MLCIQEVWGSNFRLETSHFEGFNGFPRSLQAVAGIYLHILSSSLFANSVS
jgi:hypothetical protein